METSSRSIKVLTSRSHSNGLLDNLVKDISKEIGDTEVVTMGSSLKICLLAEGKADLYPRQTPTCEWDTAAAQAVVESAGGAVVDFSLEPLRYNKKSNILNPNFVVVGDKNFPLLTVLKDLPMK